MPFHVAAQQPSVFVALRTKSNNVRQIASRTSDLYRLRAAVRYNAAPPAKFLKNKAVRKLVPESDGPENPTLSEVGPTEVCGRDTIARYRAQFRAAAYACLEILKGEGIDRVYCDYADDFVCRERQDGTRIYHFYQVKTKGKLNFQWGKGDVLGLPKRGSPKPEKILNSFAGKLLMHTVRFKNSCGNVVFLTNVYLDDELDGVSAALASGDLSHQIIKLIIENFNSTFVSGAPFGDDVVREKISRLRLNGGNSYLHPHSEDFEALAREAIFKYSEVDLQNTESQEIIKNLVSLVESKSSTKLLADLTEEDLDRVAGIGIADLLDILSISKGAYDFLVSGGDPKAVKSASIIQRKLKKAGASEQIIEYCSKWKVEWDVWLREKRHPIPEYELNTLLDKLNAIQNDWSGGRLKFSDLQSSINTLWDALSKTEIAGTLSRELLMGGVLSALVKSEAQ